MIGLRRVRRRATGTKFLSLPHSDKAPWTALCHCLCLSGQCALSAELGEPLTARLNASGFFTSVLTGTRAHESWLCAAEDGDGKVQRVGAPLRFPNSADLVSQCRQCRPSEMLTRSMDRLAGSLCARPRRFICMVGGVATGVGVTYISPPCVYSSRLFGHVTALAQRGYELRDQRAAMNHLYTQQSTLVKSRIG